MTADHQLLHRQVRWLAVPLALLLIVGDLLPLAPAVPSVSAALGTAATFVYGPPSGIGSVAGGDIDGDGDIDLIGAGVVLLNDGRGGFDTGPLNCAAAAQRCFGADALGRPADMNGDGALDIVTAAAVYLNVETTFATGALDCADTVRVRCFGSLSAPSPPPAVGDVDGDGDFDLVSVEAVFLNQDGAFAAGPPNCANRQATRCFGPPPAPANSSAGFFVTIGDIDGRRGLDLVLGARWFQPNNTGGVDRGGQSMVLFNDGSGTFAQGSLACNQAGVACIGPADYPVADLALGDWNGDGLPDVATVTSIVPVCSKCTNGPFTRGDAIFVNQGVDAGDRVSFEPAAPIVDDGGNATRVLMADLDHDARDDVIVANNGQASAVLLAGGERLNFGGASDATSDLAVVDLNGDGQAEIVTARSGLQGTVVPFVGTPFSDGPSFSSTTATPSSLAAGDMNNDGRLDLVLTESIWSTGSGQRVNIYTRRADGGYDAPADCNVAFPITCATAEGAFAAIPADMDNNGRLDLVVGVNSGQNRIYLNQDSTFLNIADRSQCVSGAAMRCFGANGARALAVGDINNDDSLDVVLTDGGTAALLTNDGNGNLTLAQTLDSGLAAAGILALGDIDRDGWLDLVAAAGGEVRLVLNDGAGRLAIPQAGTPIGVSGGTVSGLALADFDNDGALDIAVANASRINLVHLNDGDGRFDQARTRTFAVADARLSNLAAGDMDNDGDMDLVATSEARPSALYLNDGAGRFDSQGRTLYQNARRVTYVALADLDADGRLDVATAGGSFSATFPSDRRDSSFNTYLNQTTRASQQRANVPTVTVTRPDGAADAPGFVTARPLDGRSIAVSYRLWHPAGARVRRIIAQYSLDGGANWRSAVPQDEAGLQNLDTSPVGAPHSFIWDLDASGVVGQSDSVVVRLLAVPDVRPRPAATPSPSIYPFASAATNRMRVRGAGVRVLDGAGLPAAGAHIFRHDGPASVAAPFPRTNSPAASSGVWRTDQHGYLRGRAPLALGDRLVALQQVSPTSVTTYTLYHTSAAPTTEGLAAQEVRVPGVQTLTILPQHQLLLLNLNVSLEWDARGDTTYLERLKGDLQRASSYLYDWSDGQIALGRVTIHHNKGRWFDQRDPNGRIITKAADVRIYATNRLRPSASQGGIVTQDARDPDPRDPSAPAQVYEPGDVRMGAVWNRDGRPVELATSSDWASALAHELGHYALFLDDNYLGLDTAGRLITVEGCRGAMSDPYLATVSEFHPTDGWLPACAHTLSQRTAGRSDWETIARLGATHFPGFAPRAPAFFDANPGPSQLPLAVIAFSEMPASGSGPANRTLTLATPDPQAADSPTARAVLLRGVTDVVDLGQPVQDEVTVRGAAASDRVCVFDLPQSRLGCARTDASTLTIRPRADWRPDVVISEVTSQTVTLVVRADSVGAPAPDWLDARVIPSDTNQAAQTIRLLKTGDEYRATARFAEPVLEATIHVWVAGDPQPGGANTLPAREIVTDYALGGNPAPKRRPRPRSRRRAPMTSADGGLVLYTDATNFATGQFFAIQAATVLPADPPTAIPIGPGYRVLVSERTLFQQPVSLALAYAADDYPSGTEQGIAVYYQPPIGGWQRLVTQLDTDDNEAVAQAPGPGVYALMASLPWELNRYGMQKVTYPGQDTPLPAALAPLRGSFRLIYGYREQDVRDPWKVFAPEAPAWVNDLDMLHYEQTYWINVRDPLLAPVKPHAKQAVQVTEIPSPPALFYGYLIGEPGFTPEAGMELRAMIGDVVCATTFTRQVGDDIVWSIDVPAEVDEATLGCGARGRIVRFEIGEYTLPYSLPWDSSLLNGEIEPSLFLPITTR